MAKHPYSDAYSWNPAPLLALAWALRTSDGANVPAPSAALQITLSNSLLRAGGKGARGRPGSLPHARRTRVGGNGRGENLGDGLLKKLWNFNGFLGILPVGGSVAALAVALLQRVGSVTILLI